MNSSARTTGVPSRAASRPEGQRETDSHIIGRNSLVLLFRYAGMWVLNSILVLFLPRYLGDTGMGHLQYALSLVSMFGVVTALGVRQFLIKEVAKENASLSRLLAPTPGVRLLASAGVLAAIFAVGALTGNSEEGRIAVYIAALWMTIHSFGELMASVLHGREDMSRPAFAEMVKKIVVVGAGVGVLVLGWGLTGYLTVLVVGVTIELAMNARYVAQLVPIRARFEIPAMKRIVVGGSPFLFMGAILVVYHHFDVIMLKYYTNEAVVGWYAAALQIFHAVQFLPMVLATAILPTLSRAHSTNVSSVAPIVKKAFAIGGLVMAPVALGLSLTADTIINLLPYPDSFQNTVPLLSIQALSIPVTAFLTILGTIAAAVDRQKIWAIALLGTLILNITMNVFLIQYFDASQGNGAIGAALATLLSELVMVVVGVTIMPKGVMDRSTVLTFAKIGVAAGGMLAVGLGAKAIGMNVGLMIVVTAVAYGALVVATRLVSADDIRFLKELVRNKFGKA